MMPLTDLLAHSAFLFATLAGLIGLIVGSFLNVVIYRLPIMMQNSWHKECVDYLQIDSRQTGNPAPFNLALPLSHCPHCKTPIKPQYNLPIISYIVLKGRCVACGNPISKRYPFIEALTAVLSIIVSVHFGFGLPCFFALLLTWSLVALCFIDIDHHLLPDAISQPLLWIGLLLSLFNVYTDSQSSIMGAVSGYVSLRLFYHIFKFLTGKEGMGFGDFKLFALFGAWLGWQFLPQIIFISSTLGAISGITMVLFSKRDANIPIPFGPYLGLAGWIALIWGQKLNDWYLNLMGL